MYLRMVATEIDELMKSVTNPCNIYGTITYARTEGSTTLPQTGHQGLEHSRAAGNQYLVGEEEANWHALNEAVAIRHLVRTRVRYGFVGMLLGTAFCAEKMDRDDKF
eukprot:Protomagalhaensia_wolfi_Nauph_80__2265@NODE_2479_length_1080_cov_9_262248_g1942_i0_p2_GENE_NODE_2479_length_1080_cov_9_262248_g1942_i0NODE_2479_length_1080_cov_9_262248_g1942_i0_p2_ORF_typecomplete_len107_score4_46_NODE_2479_length_1080_cov_9_262248_g1942_i0601921